MRRGLAWLAAAPFVAAGVLAAHDAAYLLTGTPSGSLHAYLEHAPEALLLACVLGLAAIPLSGRPARVSAPMFVLAAAGVFAVQEHLERIVHDGTVPLLVGSPVFLLGLLLQVPVGLAMWAVACWLLAAAAAERPRRRPRLPRILLALRVPASEPLRAFAFQGSHARAPPVPPGPR